MQGMDDLIRPTQAMARERGIVFTDEQAECVAGLFWRSCGEADQLVWEAFVAGRLSADQLTFLATSHYKLRPDGALVDAALWREVFLRCRYTDDGKIADPPTRPLLAFRGAAEENKRGVSWTLDPHEAAYFARNRVRVGEARVWSCWIPADRQLARYTVEREVVADVRGLEIRLADSLTRCERARVWLQLRLAT